MINVYDNLRENSGNIILGRTKLFIKEVDSDGKLLSCQSGELLTPEGSGTLFIVDDWLIDQLDKVVFKDGTLQVKDGEQLDEPVKSDLQLEEEALLKRLAELQAQKNTEEPTDEP